jgi:hypothetical protein
MLKNNSDLVKRIVFRYYLFCYEAVAKHNIVLLPKKDLN